MSLSVFRCRKKTGSPQTIASDGSSQDGGSSSAAITPTGTPPTGTSCKEAWPSLHLSGSPSSQSPETVMGRPERLTNGNKSKSKNETSDSSDSSNSSNSSSNNHRAPGHHRTKHNSGDSDQNRYSSTLEGVLTLDEGEMFPPLISMNNTSIS